MDIDDMFDDETFDLTEIKNEKKEVKSDDDIEKELENGKEKRQKQKRVGILFASLSLLFIPGLISLLVIGTHSNELVTKKLFLVFSILLSIFIIVFIFGMIMYLKNIKISAKAKVRKGFKYFYIAMITLYVTMCAIVLVLLYGPVPDFRDWLVTTAMQTMDHKHYCTWFYNQKEIDEVFSRNYLQEPEGNTDENLVNTEPEPAEPTDQEAKVYENEYEQAVLEKDPGNEYYKIINLTVNGCKGYLAVIYDPSMVHVTTTNRVGISGQYVTTMAKREKAMVAINGAGFHDPNYTSSGGCPKGITIVNGKIITNNEYGRAATGGLIGLTRENKLILLRNVTAQQAINQGVRDAVSWGPFLVVNGKAAYSKGNGGWGKAARTAIGQRRDGIILMLVVDSNYNRTKGADMGDMADIMVKYGAVNASNLDGGTSSVMAVNGNLISHPIDSALQNETRPVATAFVVKK